MSPASAWSPISGCNRDANLNIIRNWVGQNTEETFYDLADEYGMMVWNDFWESTENYNIEAAGSRSSSSRTPRHHPALPQPSLHRHVVRPQRRRASAHHQPGP